MRQKFIDALPTTLSSWVTLACALALVIAGIGISIVKGHVADGTLETMLTYATLFLGIQKTGSTVSDVAAKKYTSSTSNVDVSIKAKAESTGS